MRRAGDRALEWHFTTLSPEADFGCFAWSRALQMAALPFLFLTVTSNSYVGLPPEKSGQASALINGARNLGGSIGVSATQTLLARRAQFHQSRLAEHLTSSSLAYRETLQQAGAHFKSHGASAADAQGQATAWVGQTVVNQSMFLAYIDVFAMIGVLAAIMAPVSFLLRRVDLAKRPAAH